MYSSKLISSKGNLYPSLVVYRLLELATKGQTRSCPKCEVPQPHKHAAAFASPI